MLRNQLAEIQIERMKSEIARLRGQLAEMQALHRAQDAVVQYLATQTEAIDEDQIQVKARRATLQKALRQLVAAGKVNRVGAGKKANPYRYGIPGSRNESSNT